MNNQEILNALNEKIKAAEEALLYLKQTKAGLERVIENSTKTPAEEAYKDWWGEYPTKTWQVDVDRWNAFQAGYNAAYEEKVTEKDMVKENLKTSLQEMINGDVRPIDDVVKEAREEQIKKLQEKEWTYKVTDEKGETNPYKSYMNSVTTLRQELFDYGFTDSQIEDIILIVNRILPEPIKETCGMKDWDSAWTIGYNNYRDTLMEKLK